jgi:pimeloyl-ACP methyl ester carboxylesterase
MLLFQFPWLPEALARWGEFALAERMVNDVVHRDGFTADEVARYKQAIAQPGALTAAVNYYRAMRDRPSRRMLFAPLTIDAPAMLIWGDRDRYLRTQLADASRRWVQNDVPGKVNALLLDFLAQLR